MTGGRSDKSSGNKGRTTAERISVAEACKCPKCGRADTLEQIGTVPTKDETVKQMKCKTDGEVIFCHEKEGDEEDKDCECPECHTKPGSGLTEKKREQLGGQECVTYKCDKCGKEVRCAEKEQPDECKCKCGNKDPSLFKEISREPMADGKTFTVTYECQKPDKSGKKCGKQFKCQQQDGGGKCVCPKCEKFDATEVPGSRKKIVSGSDGEVWEVEYECNTDHQRFKCQEQKGKECKCDKCGSKEMTEIPPRTKNPDGSSTIHFKCNKCGEEYQCSEGEGNAADCVCPTCKKHPADAPDEFEVSEPFETADGKMKRKYKHKPDGTEFECQEAGEEDVCKCPKCKKTSGFTTLERIKTATGVTLKLKCSCGFGPFTCDETKADPCKCPECDSSDELEEIDTEKIGGGAIHHWKCKLGHTKHLSGKCSKGLAGCVADCVETDDDKPPECICPSCKKSDGLVTLGTTEVVYEGQKLTIRHLKCKCGFISGKCTEPTGKFVKEEAVECISVEPDEPKCPKCGKAHFRIVKTEEVEME